MKAQRRSAQWLGEHEDEAAPGLPAPLPPGERLLWQGAPDWRLLARHAFHFRWLVGYFVLLAVWQFGTTLYDGQGLLAALAGVAWTGALAALALGLVALLCRLAAQTTVYSLTERRIVMRVGIVLTVTFNIPFTRIDAAGLHPLQGDAGDIALQLDARDRIAYLHLWPHVRPWRFARTEPMLRALPDARVVAGLLADALQRHAEQDQAVRVRTAAAQPVPMPAPREPAPREAAHAVHGAHAGLQPASARAA